MARPVALDDPEDRHPHKHFKDARETTTASSRKARASRPGSTASPSRPRGRRQFESHPKGFIGLQVHGVGNSGPYEVAWRNLKIREIAPAKE